MRKVKQLQFDGLGFPLILLNPSYKKLRGQEILDVDFDYLQQSAFAALVRKPSSFSGAELKFVRLHMAMTQNTFADFLGVDRSSVGKWEVKDLEWTGMTIPTETLVRVKMVQYFKGSIDTEMKYLEPGARKQKVGDPIMLAA